MAGPKNFDFFVIKVYYEKLGHILKPVVPKFCPDLCARLRDIAEKQVHVSLKPIVGAPIKDAPYLSTYLRLP